MSLVEQDAQVDPRLEDAWAAQPGLVGWIGQCNHKAVGRRFIGTAFVFFQLAGVFALLMRVQLAVPEAGFLGADTYNALFTMHGTVMMFMFVVPILEGFTIYLAPLMLGARDMPMPRLNAFGYWVYLFGGIFLFSSFAVGAVPDSGWFAYVPLTRSEFSPGLNTDFWLLGVTFVEISAIVAAIEIIVLIARSRAAGMSVTHMPVFAWSGLVTSLMILFAFPPLIAGSVMLELDRKVGTLFYDPAGGGDPFLWQHLFWFFGHPEVYIQLIPGLGMAAAVLTTATRRPLQHRTLVIASLVAIGILSFGLWVHHMFAGGIPVLAMSLFTAASFMITIPTGVIVFAFIATLWRGVHRWTAAALYAVGFIVIFVAGGITGVMVASVPFNWQVHDSYFVVGHFHYVLVGGSVFPVFAALHHWLPKITGHMLHEGLGKTSFWLFFVGFHVTFFPHHVLGLLGMPRRVYTYADGLGWTGGNLVSTVGAFVIAAGVLLFVVNVARSLRQGPAAGADPWGGGTLEWSVPSPPPNYNFAAVPIVSSAYPLWDPPTAAVPQDTPWRRRLAAPERAVRESLSTTGLDARPEHVIELPGHSLWPILLAAALSLLLLGLLIDSLVLIPLGLLASASCLVGWLWPGRQP